MTKYPLFKMNHFLLSLLAPKYQVCFLLPFLLYLRKMAKATCGGFGYSRFRRWQPGRLAHLCAPSSSSAGKQVHGTISSGHPIRTGMAAMIGMAMSLCRAIAAFDDGTMHSSTMVLILACARVPKLHHAWQCRGRSG